jgi:hypothetical protein
MVAMQNPLESFIWGEGGAALTPEEIALRRAAEEEMRGGIDTSPVGHWTQGAARVADALAGAVRRGRLARAEKANSSYNAELLGKLIGGGAGGTSTTPTSTASTTPTSAAPIDMSGNEVYASFMDTVKQGGVTNPYALAAIAATGKAESGWSPGNVNRTWNDPGQSGQPGTAGGIMSWRGPRYEALAATGDLSPAGQAKFFLNEDPQLIAALNNAGSVEEAMGLMNNAWKFAGYNRPGGEAANRLSYAQSYLPTFQDAGAPAAPVQVASLDPSIGVGAPAAQPDGTNLDRSGMPMIDEPVPAQDQPIPVQTTTITPGQAPAQAMPQVIQPAPAAPAPVQMAQAAPTMPAAPQGVPRELLLKALTDPRANDSVKSVAKVLLQQQMAQDQAARQRAYELQDRQATWGREDARNNVLDNRYNQEQEYKQQQDERLFGLNQEKFDFQREQAGSTTNIKEFEYAKANGFTGSLQDWMTAKQGGMSLQVDPTTGQVTFQQGGNIKPLTEGQSKDTVFVTRAAGALPILDEFENSLTGQEGVIGNTVGQLPVVGNFMKTEGYQKAEQAGLEFLQAVLRKDTGAAITTAEQNEYGRVYLPYPGDSPDVLAQKKQSRLRAVEAIKAGMPPAAILAQERALRASGSEIQNPSNKALSGVSDGGPKQIKTVDDYNALPSGAQYIDPNGKLRTKR